MESDSLVTFCIPDTLLLKIFQYLEECRDLVAASMVCMQWWKVSCDETLWKELFISDFRLSLKIKIEPSATLWRSEYVRLVDKVPRVESQVLIAHEDEVVHVAFSNNGSFFSTCSKDCTVKVWTSNYPCKLLFDEDLSKYSWLSALTSQFNKSDTLLLVSGMKSETDGELACFEVGKDTLTLICRIVSKPSDIFCCWFSNNSFIAGNLHYIEHLTSNSDILLYEALPKTRKKSTAHLRNGRMRDFCRLFKFINWNASTIRFVLVSEFVSSLVLKSIEFSSCGNSVDFDSSATNDCASTSTCKKMIETDDSRLLIFVTGVETHTPHQVGFKLVKRDQFDELLNRHDYGEREYKRMRPFREEQEDAPSSSKMADNREHFYTAPPFIKKRDLPNRNAESNDPSNRAFLERIFDSPDHTIDLRGHVVGVALSRCQRYLFVNVRPWPIGSVVENVYRPPPIAEQIELRVIDLEKLILLEDVGYYGHKGFSKNDQCFFIFLDPSELYIASGSEDKFAYVWDRHYGKLIAQLAHDGVVNSVAFNPKSQEMLVTVSDDHRIKIWRSKNVIRQLNR